MFIKSQNMSLSTIRLITWSISAFIIVFHSFASFAEDTNDNEKGKNLKMNFLHQKPKSTDNLGENSVLTISPETATAKAYATYDFGKVKEGDRPNHTFEYKNTTEKDIKIISSRVPCGCAEIGIQNKILKPGESTLFNVALDSRKHQGPIKKNFYLMTDNKDKPLIKYEIKAVILAKPAPICYFPPQIDIPALKPDEKKEIKLPIENRGLKDLVIQYRKPSQAIKVLTQVPFVIPPAQTKDFIFEFTAKANTPPPDDGTPLGINDKIIFVTNDPRKKICLLVIKGEIQEKE